MKKNFETLSTIANLEELINSKDKNNYIPVSGNVLVRTEIVIKSIPFKLGATVGTSEDAPPGLLKITRFIHAIPEVGNSEYKVGDRVEINTRDEAILGLRINLTEKTLEAFTYILTNMLEGVNKSLGANHPTFTVFAYDSMPKHLIIGKYK